MRELFKALPRRRQSARYRNGERTSVVRALTGARLYLNIATPPPTVAEAAVKTGSNPAYVKAAVTLLQSEDAELIDKVVRGRVPLMKAAATVQQLH